MSLVGRLEDLALPDIFQIISLSKKTGTLIVRSRKGVGMVVFKNGQVIQAANDSIRDSLGNILVSQGMLNEAALTKALAQQKEEPRKEITILKSMFDELRFPTATSEVTLLILRYASEFVNRSVLFMVKKDMVRGLGQFGIELKGASADQVVRNIKIPLNKPSLFSPVLETHRSSLGPVDPNEANTYLANELGGDVPEEAMVIPLIVDGKIALIVYGDNLPDRKPIKGMD